MFDLARLSPLFARWRRRVIFWLPGLLGLFLLLSGAGTGLDQLLRNMRDGIRSHPASGEIHIVEIDARSLAEFGKWPLPRRIHAAAIDRLHRAGARSIAFDEIGRASRRERVCQSV